MIVQKQSTYKSLIIVFIALLAKSFIDDSKKNLTMIGKYEQWKAPVPFVATSLGAINQYSSLLVDDSKWSYGS